jgi:hypothetical protein
LDVRAREQTGSLWHCGCVKHLRIIAFLAALGVTVPIHVKADDTPVFELPLRCQAAAFWAHPPSLPNSRAALNLRYSYYKLCLARRGKISPSVNVWR